MKYAYYGFGMLLFGSIGLVIIVMMQSITINNDSEYYNLKEAMQAAMLESIDYVCYRVDGESVSSTNNNECGYLLKISEQKFVDNFTRRFIATVGGDAKNYTLEFYDIIESPPKASVVIKGLTNDYGIVSQNKSLTITNSLSGILELKNKIDKHTGEISASIPNPRANSDAADNDDTAADNVFVDDTSSETGQEDENDYTLSNVGGYGTTDGVAFCENNPNYEICKNEPVSDDTEIAVDEDDVENDASVDDNVAETDNNVENDVVQ